MEILLKHYNLLFRIQYLCWLEMFGYRSVCVMCIVQCTYFKEMGRIKLSRAIAIYTHTHTYARTHIDIYHYKRCTTSMKSFVWKQWRHQFSLVQLRWMNERKKTNERTHSQCGCEIKTEKPTNYTSLHQYVVLGILLHWNETRYTYRSSKCLLLFITIRRREFD